MNTQIRNSNTVFIPQTNTHSQNIQRQPQALEPIQTYIPIRNDTHGSGNNNNSGNSPQYVNITVQNTAIHNRDNYKVDCQNIVIHHPPKVKNIHEKLPKPNKHMEKFDKPYENIAISSSSSTSNSGNNKHVASKRSRASSSSYNKIQKQENTYENFLMDKNNIPFNRSETILENNPSTDNVYKVKKMERVIDFNSTGELYEEISVYDNRHHTILNFSEYQSSNLPLLKSQKDNSTKHMHRDRKLRIGERSESNLKNLLKLSDIRELPLHRTLPKNLHELITREIPNDKIDADNLRRSQSSNYETNILNPSKSYGSLIDNVKPDKTNDTMTIQGTPLNIINTKEPKSRIPNEDDLSFVSYQCLSSSQDDDDYRYILNSELIR